MGRIKFLSIRIGTLVMLICMVGCRQEKVSVTAPTEEFTAYLDRQIPKWMDQYEIPGTSIALVKEGKTIWTKAYGYADLATGRKMTVDTRCRVESISKSVTTWGVLKLVDEGKIALDTPVIRYLKDWNFPESSYSEENLTVRHLLSQSGGMPLGTIGVRYSPMENKPTLQEYLSENAILFQEPGTTFFYSNTGYNLLELLIEEVTEQDFASYMEEEILVPLEMHKAGFNWREDFQPEVPFGYNLDGDAIPVYVYPNKAAGGLFATVSDISSFVSAGMTSFNSVGSQVLDPAFIDTLYTAAVPLTGYYSLIFDSYGFGHFIEILPNGMKSISHGGQGSGWMTHFQAVPETGDGIVILTNSQRSWPFFGLILMEWAEWNGFESIGMGYIVWVDKILKILLAALFVIILWRWVKWVRDIIQYERKFSFPGRINGLRAGQITGSLLLFLTLWWMLAQPYFFLFSVFPVTSRWLIFMIFLTAMTLLLQFLFPKNHNPKQSNSYDMSEELSVSNYHQIS